MELFVSTLLLAAAASAHCVGMCGGFALHLTGRGSMGAVAARQALWNMGRIITYVFLGAIAGYLGAVFFARPDWMQVALAYLLPVIMIVMGLAFLGLIPARRGAGEDSGKWNILSLTAGRFFNQPGAASALALGIGTGFLPCPITGLFLLQSAAAGSVAKGMEIMAAMGIGTCAGLLVVAAMGQMIQVKWRRRGMIVIGIMLIALGAWNILHKAGALPALPMMEAMSGCHCG